MPSPFRGIITKRTSDATLIRADKSQRIRRLYAQLGPEEFYRRRLTWLARNKKRTSYVGLVDYLRRAGIDPGVLQPL
jgi:hypothetical protein